MFKITRNKGFHMTFENGYTISVQFGMGNYCNNRYQHNELSNRNGDVPCEDAEIAIWYKDGQWATKEFFENLGDDVKGYLSADEVADLIARVKNHKHMKTHYRVPFMEDGGGFIFNFLWDKETKPTKEEVLEIFKNGDDDEESYNGWKDLMVYEELEIFS